MARAIKYPRPKADGRSTRWTAGQLDSWTAGQLPQITVGQPFEICVLFACRISAESAGNLSQRGGDLMVEWSVAGWRMAGLILIATDHRLEAMNLPPGGRNSSHKQKAPVIQDGCGKFHSSGPVKNFTREGGGCVWKSMAASGSSSNYHKICRDNACATRNPMQIRFSELADTNTDSDTDTLSSSALFRVARSPWNGA